MIVKDPLFDRYVTDNVTFDHAFQVLATVTMFLIGYRAYRRGIANQAAPSP